MMKKKFEHSEILILSFPDIFNVIVKTNIEAREFLTNQWEYVIMYVPMTKMIFAI